ncbi:MAG: hypothetical protein EZS28_021778 [Streblomastix strix]|uniref:Ubiquitin-like domain-containing protein n=1 Tax=Streblomastix strix TaxID=222440 RepID=A0A5J4VJS0_9EUKA|nr:MAG: hypothetical protein EZS28_021778 [Streblomastix strix]
MKVNIQQPDQSQRTQVECEQEDTVDLLKEKIEGVLHVPRDRQRLIMNGRIIRGGTLSSNNIGDNSTVYLIVQIPPPQDGAQPSSSSSSAPPYANSSTEGQNGSFQFPFFFGPNNQLPGMILGQIFSNDLSFEKYIKKSKNKDLEIRKEIRKWKQKKKKKKIFQYKTITQQRHKHAHRYRYHSSSPSESESSTGSLALSKSSQHDHRRNKDYHKRHGHE